jgi:uncharacterized membrane protein YdjX (TVP38/TMEM64 family)
MIRRYKPLLLIGLLAVMLSAAALLPLGDWLTAGVAWIEAHRALAWAAYVSAYVVATVLVIPGSILTLAAGFIFGLPLGVALVSAGSVLGASCAFLMGRFLARDWIAQRIAGMPRFNALDQATRHEGFLIVLLARLSPLFPFNLLNYALGLTGVRFRDYFLASWIGMLPATVLYVYIGSAAMDLAQLSSGELQGGMTGRALFVAGLVATLVLTVLITRKATSTLAQHLERELADNPEG